jgi:hypothetical protein
MSRTYRRRGAVILMGACSLVPGGDSCRVAVEDVLDSSPGLVRLSHGVLNDPAVVGTRRERLPSSGSGRDERALRPVGVRHGSEPRKDWPAEAHPDIRCGSDTSAVARRRRNWC